MDDPKLSTSQAQDVAIAAAQAKASAAAPKFSSFTPAVPSVIPKIGDRVNFILPMLGSGVKFFPKIRAAVVTEDWLGSEPHPRGFADGPDGLPIAKDGKACLPVGCVNLQIHLDGHGSKDLREGHYQYAGDVLYDPTKTLPKSWHWPSD